MLEQALELAASNPWALIVGALVLDIPRYTFSLVSLAALLMLTRRAGVPRETVSISVIMAAFNGGEGIARTVASLRRQTLQPLEIIIIDDGSTDATRAISLQLQACGAVDLVIGHGTRCGRSAAVNAGARFARGDLLLTADADTTFDPTTLARMAAAFRDPRVAAASCNLDVANEADTLVTGLQGVEYLMSFSAGRSFLDLIAAIACCSGACAMYRRDVFRAQGGLDVGPGEDLEFTLRLRRLGHTIRFVPEAWASTGVPDTVIGLLRQRARWDRDALRIRLVMYGELALVHRRERLADTLQRLDFIALDLVPTLLFPFYLAYLLATLGAAGTLVLLAAVYAVMLAITAFNIALAFALFSRSASLFGLLLLPVFPLYQGIALKCARFVSYSAEILFAASRHDDFVPPRVRRALLGAE